MIEREQILEVLKNYDKGNIIIGAIGSTLLWI